MAINQLSTANTFYQWLNATQSLIEKYNYYEVTTNLVFSNANLVVSLSSDVNAKSNLVNTRANLINSLSLSVNNQSLSVNAQTNVVITTSDAIRAYVNLAYTTANATYIHANAGFLQANASYLHANAAYTRANAGFLQANTGFAHANAGYLQANNAYNHGNAANTQAIASFVKANAAFVQANAGYLHANSGFGHANSGYLQANAAFIQANAANVQGNSAFIQANAAFVQANAANVQAIASFVKANAAYLQANTGFNHANAGYLQANTGFNHANAGYLQANGAYLHANAANNQAIASFVVANSAYLHANAANIQAIASFAQANVAFTQANAGFTKANSAYLQANTGFNHANAGFLKANGAYLHANAGYEHANALYIVANTIGDIVANSVLMSYLDGLTGNIQDQLDGKASLNVATTSANGLMSSTDKTKLNGIESGATADQTPTEILTAIKTVDGSGSGLDADLLDGLDSTSFPKLSSYNTFSNSQLISTAAPSIELKETDQPSGFDTARMTLSGGALYLQGTPNSFIYMSGYGGQDALGAKIKIGGTYYDFWHAGNDGAGSGLDADLLDGLQASSAAANSTIVSRDSTGYSFFNGVSTEALTGPNAFFRKYRETFTPDSYLTIGQYIRVCDITPSGNSQNYEFKINGIATIGPENHEFDIFVYVRSTTLPEIFYGGVYNGIKAGTALSLEVIPYIWFNPTTGTVAVAIKSTTTSIHSIHLNIEAYSRSSGIYEVIYPGSAVKTSSVPVGYTEYPLSKNLEISALGMTHNGNTVWTAGNDGSGSTLDADTLDTLHASSFLRSDTDGTLLGSLTIQDTSSTVLNVTSGVASGADSVVKIGGARTSSSTSNIAMVEFNNDVATPYTLGQIAAQDPSGSSGLGNGRLIFRTSSGGVLNDKLIIPDTGSMTFEGNTVWHAGNDGSGSTLDADTVDNIHASSFLRSDTADTATGSLTFTGTITLPSTTSIGTITSTELGYLDGVTSSIQTQLNAKAPSASPTFTGTVTLPSTTSIGTITSTELGYVDGVTSSIQTQLDAKAPLASPTFTGTVTLPSTTSIGTITSTELGYLDGVTSSIQTQLNAKAPLASPAFTGNIGVNTARNSERAINSTITSALNSTTYGIYNNIVMSDGVLTADRSTYGIYNYISGAYTNDLAFSTNQYAAYNRVAASTGNSVNGEGMIYGSYNRADFTSTDSTYYRIENGYGAYNMCLSSGNDNSLIDNAYGSYNYVQTTGTAAGNTAITSADAVRAQIAAGAGRNITNAYGFRLAVTETGTITNKYGVYITPTWNNYFAGGIQIGGTATSPVNYNLDVTGTARITGTTTLPTDTSIGDVSSTEISYLDGVTSSIQTQLNGKQATITGGATTIVSSNLTASRALVSDGSGKVAVSAVTSTQLGYVSGVTSAIQTQLNGKQATLASVSNFELGNSLTGDRSSYIDFHSDDTNTDYSARFIRNAGVDGVLAIQQVGTGDINFTGGGEITRSGYKMWHAGNDGSGSGLDADTLDTIHASSFLRSDATDTASGNLTFTGTIVLPSSTNIKTINGTSLIGSGDISIVSSKSASVIGTNTSAVVNTIYVMTAALTLTLPSTPSAGDEISISDLSGSRSVVIARNGNPIMGVAEDMTLDTDYSGFTLVYIDSTRGVGNNLNLSNYKQTIQFYQIGEMIWAPLAFVNDPNANGWFQCDGRVLLQATYPTLFTRLGLIKDIGGTSYSYNTSTEFVLPRDVWGGDAVYRFGLFEFIKAY